MADILTMQDLANGHLDVKALGEAANGDENTIVTTRTGNTYPSAERAINIMFQNGGLPATPFVTKALMTASALVDGQYAQVTDDTANNGLYIKTAGTWVKSNYDPLGQALAYVDSNALFKPQNIASSDNLDTYLTNGIYVRGIYTSGSLELGYPTKNARGFLTVWSIGNIVIQRFVLSDNGIMYTRTSLVSPVAFTPWKKSIQEGDLKKESLYTQLEWQGRSKVGVTYNRDTQIVRVQGLLIAAYPNSALSVRISNVTVQFTGDYDYAVCYIDLIAMEADGVIGVKPSNQDLYIKVGRYVGREYVPEVGKVPLFKFDAMQNKAVACSGFPAIVTVGGAGDEVSDIELLPTCFYKKTTDMFTAYVQIKNNLYVGFSVEHRVRPDELIYIDYWRILKAGFYNLVGENMVATGKKALGIGESEFVIKQNSDKDDATGGYHGDEQMLSVMFLANGLPIDISTDIPLTPCNEVEYIIKSNLHETSEGGVAIVGHPVIAEHWKRTKFSNRGYTTYNKAIWKYEGNIGHFYHGLSCISKDVATTVMTGTTLEPQEMTGTATEYFRETGASEYIGWNDDTGLSVHANSKLIYNSEGESTGFLFVSDRSVDSKYYCKDANFISRDGAIIETEFTCQFNSK